MDIILNVLNQTLVFTIPLLVVALGGMFSERSGVVNIALEGIMIGGAFVGVYFIYLMQLANASLNPQLLLILALIVAGVPFSNTFRIHEIPVLSQIPILGPILFKGAYITTYLGIIILILSVIFLNKTRAGLRLRACGENPQAADAAGVSVYKYRYIGVLLSGFLGGMGGLIYIIPISTVFNSDVGGYLYSNSVFISIRVP